jgi:MerR family transcriptional regulator, light-induced transcriptional regulator
MNVLNLASASDEPLYNIGIVSRMTGIPVATLRVWERRYGFPKAIRTPGGHRLCSEREVMRLRWVKARVDDGMQTGQAIRALQHMEQEGRFSDITPAPIVRPTMTDTSLMAFHQRLFELLIHNDLQQSDQMLGEVLTLYPIEDLILDVMGPTLQAIGQAWKESKISVATEHLATNYLRQHLLLWMMTGPAAYDRVPPVVMACAPDEWHEGSLLIMSVLLRRRRWPIAYLGQAVPLPDLADLVRRMHAPAVVLVAMMEPAAESLRDWPQYLPEAAETGRPIVVFGGEIFNKEPEWRTTIPGIFLGETLREGVEKLDELLHTMFTPGTE